MPPKLLDIYVEIPPAISVSADDDVSHVKVLDAGVDNPAERATFVHFYAAAMAVLIEMRQRSKGGGNGSSVFHHSNRPA